MATPKTGNTVPTVDDPTATPADDPNGGLFWLAAQMAAVEAKYREQVEAINNWTPPKLEKIPGAGLYAYLTSPVRLKRIFGSPLVLEGEFAYGDTRIVTNGWGAASYTGIVHTGLDFPAVYGEEILACAGGRVAFVGYIRASDNKAMAFPAAYQDPEGDVHGPETNIIVLAADVANGGIAVRVEHNGDFAGYRTEYYHLSEVSVKLGDRVTEGQKLGYVGTSGNAVDPHLHLTVSYSRGGRAVTVKPSAIVPNYYQGHEDTTGVATTPLKANLISPGPGGQTLISGVVATSLGTLNRSTDLQNTTRESVVAAQTAHLAYTAQTTGQQKRQLYEAAAKYQQAGLVVIDAMTYNFETGMWYLGDVPDAPV